MIFLSMHQAQHLFEMGNTKVLCSVTLQQGVPHFLRGKKTGWLTAEYSLLPASTPIRTVREVTANKRSGRTIEISRLIGRSLRSVVNLDALGEQTIFMDCDVLQADGGTRTACITSAYLALRAAQANWAQDGLLHGKLLIDELAAVSVGITEGLPLLDLDFVEDSATEADFNFVLTRSGRLIEIQGSAERFPLTWTQYDEMKVLALKGVAELFAFYDRSVYTAPEHKLVSSPAQPVAFSLLTDDQAIPAAWRPVAATTTPTGPTAATSPDTPKPRRLRPDHSPRIRSRGLRRPARRPARHHPAAARHLRPSGPRSPSVPSGAPLPHRPRQAAADAHPRRCRRAAVPRGAVARSPGQPAAPADITGLALWFAFTARSDLAPPPRR